MVFSSPIFLFLFLPIVLSTYFLIRKDLRNIFLVVASLAFYSWGEGFYVLILVTSITLNYGFGLAVQECREGTLRKLVIAFAVAANLTLIGTFKYANFFVGNVNPVLAAAGLQAIHLQPVHLPIGISFFTFQAISYLVDIYRGEVVAQKNPLRIALLESLFPHQIAGPIVRYKQIAEELVSRTVSWGDFAKGVERFAIGLGKKALIANAVALPADKIFALPVESQTAGLAWFGALCYTLQIYFDFSGYTDMAIGLARMLGFHFPENFNYPYVATSIRDFWRRWHISLSMWFRDYVYIPLGGGRVRPCRVYANLLVVFFLCGLWHGASWNFVIWGLFHGVFIAGEHAGLDAFLKRAGSVFSHLYTVAIVMVAWVFFRADTLPYALSFIGAMFGFGHGDGVRYHVGLYLDNHVLMALAAGILFSAPIAPRLEMYFREFTNNRPEFRFGCWEIGIDLGRKIVLVGVFLLATLCVASGTYNPFIYFRF